jgi:hypothetical protein
MVFTHKADMIDLNDNQQARRVGVDAAGEQRHDAVPAHRAPVRLPDSPGLDESLDQHRRQYDRVPGPFDGRRVGLLETPIRLYDLSLGGCFVNSMHEQQEGSVISLKIDLPREGWISVKAETLYRRPNFGFAVRFVEMSVETAACLERTIRAIQNRQPHDSDV